MEFWQRLTRRDRSPNIQKLATPTTNFMLEKNSLGKRFSHKDFIKEVEALPLDDLLENFTYKVLNKLEDKDKAKWYQVNIQAVETMVAIHPDQETSEENLSEKTRNYKKAIDNLREMASSIVGSKFIDRANEFATKRGLQSEIQDVYTDLSLGIYGNVNIPIEGISIKEFANGDFTKHNSQKLFRYFTRCLKTSKLGEAPQPDLTLNFFCTKYPNLYEFEMIKHTIYVSNALNITKKDIEANKSDVFKESTSYKTAIKVKENIEASKEKILNDSLNPYTTEFRNLKSEVTEQFHRSPQEMVLACFALGLDNPKNIKDAYRKAKKFIADGIEVEFYETLVSTIESLMEDAPNLANFQRIEDVDTIYSFNINEGEEKPSPEELAQITNEIFKNSSNRYYEIDPQDIDWEKLVPPQEVSITFDQNRPKKFDIRLTWENEEGEELEPTFHFDTAKNIFDWTFLEEPQDPEMSEFVKSMNVVAKNILNNVKTEAETYHQQKLASKQPAFQQPQTKVSRIQRKERQNHRKHQETEQLTTLELSLSGTPQSKEAERKIRTNIKVSNPEQFQKQLSKLGSKDQAIVLKAIESANNSGEISPKRLRASGPNGEPMYSLRITTTVPAGVRLICRDTESTQDLRNYEIVAIGNRGDIYKSSLLN